MVVWHMFSLIIVAMFAVGSLLAAWLVNGLVGLLSGERPRDTGRLWLDIFLRLFAVLELGFIGRILGYVGIDGLPRKVVLFVGLACLMLFLAKACHHERHEEHQYLQEIKFDEHGNITNCPSAHKAL